MENTKKTVAEKEETVTQEGKMVGMIPLGYFKVGAMKIGSDRKFLEDIEIKFGIDPKEMNPVIVCEKTSSAQAFTWDWLVKKAIKNKLLDSLLVDNSSEVQDEGK